MKVYVDGSSDGKFCYFVDETGEGKVSRGKKLTNIQAEYKAIIMALRNIKGVKITIYSDNQPIVGQLNHKWHIRDDDLRALALKVWKLIGKRKVSFRWVPREKNKAGKILG